MQFQQALIHAMEYQGITQAELAARSDTNPRWILHITTKTDWVPKLDTVLRLCYALRFDVLSFLEYAEVGSRGNEFPVPSSQFPGPQATEQQRMLLDLKPLHIAKALKTLRLEHGLSQRRLHTLTQFSIYSISLREGERYQNYPTITTLKLYCDAFHIHLSSLVGRALSYV